MKDPIHSGKFVEFPKESLDQIVTRQTADPRLFGEIGISLKFISEEQVDHLLALQRFHRCLDLGAMLVIDEQVSLSTLLHAMADFFKRPGTAASC